MSPTLPTLCGSMAAHPYRLAVELHNAAYRELGLDYTFVYFGITDPAAGIEAIRTLGIRGMNVSMPFKAAVIPYLDRLDPAARAIGAVNTIDHRDGVLTGYNTDYIGGVKALEEVTSLAGTRIALLGAGGAARFAIVADGKEIFRTGEIYGKHHTLTWGTKAPVKLDVTGVQLLELRTIAVRGGAGAWSCWGDPKVR